MEVDMRLGGKLLKKAKEPLIGISFFVCIILALFFGLIFTIGLQEKSQLSDAQTQKAKLALSLTQTQKAYDALRNQDQYKINQQLKQEIDRTHLSYKNSIDLYQKMLDLRAQGQDISDFETMYASVVRNLSDLQYASADSQLQDLSGQIKTSNDKLAAAQAAEAAKQAAAAAVPQNAPAGTTISTAAVNNAAPSNGFSQQQVQTDTGTFTVDIIAGDLNSTRVIVDTASDGDCSNNCPVLPLGTYIARSGAYAGINGTFFCPTAYPSCAGKTNSFDTLLMNKNKVYFNSANNVYSTVPAAIFSGNSARFVGQSSQWGRDTGVDSVIAMQPGLLFGGQIAYDAAGGSVGLHSFLANKGSTVYIGFVFNSTYRDVAHVMKTLGIDNAINLDEGGSSALMWGGSYLIGPGRDLPNAVLFVRK